MIALLLASLIAGAPVQAEVGTATDALIRQAIDQMLEGRELASETEAQIIALPAEERLKVLIVLRRSGMLTGPTWPVERILAP